MRPKNYLGRISFFFILIETSLEKVVVQYPNILKFL